MAGSRSGPPPTPRPSRRPCKFAGMTLVSLTTSASPLRNNDGRSPMARSSTGAPGRTTRSRAASRGVAGRSAMRSSGSAKSNSSVRMFVKLPAGWAFARAAIASYRIDCRSGILVEHDLFRKPVSTFRDHALKGPYRNLLRGNQCDPERGHPGQIAASATSSGICPLSAPSPRPSPGGQRDVPGTAVERRQGTARGRAERRRDALFPACRLGASARAQSDPARAHAAAPSLSTDLDSRPHHPPGAGRDARRHPRAHRARSRAAALFHHQSRHRS